MSETRRSEVEVRNEIKLFKKRYCYYRKYINKHKPLKDKKKWVGSYSKRCPKLLTSINVLRWSLHEPALGHSEIDSWFSGESEK